MPVTPQKAAGIRTEPAVSVPRDASTRPAATAAPLPPLEPPQMCSGFHGLSAGPKCGLVVEAPYANSWVLSFPAIVPPAARSRATQSASSSGTRWSTFDAAVVGMPATSMTSFTAITVPPSPGWGSRWRNALNGSSVTASPPREALLELAERGQDALEEAEHALQVLVLGKDALRSGDCAQVLDGGDGARLCAHADLRVPV